MKNEPLLKFVGIATLTGLLLAFANAARASDAATSTRSGTYTTRQGSALTSTTTTRGNGTVTRQGTWTNAAGGTGTWQSQSVHDKATHTTTFSGSRRRPDGATTSWQGTAVRTAPGTVTLTGTVTGPNGKVATYTATRTRVSPGVWDEQRAITTADGKLIHRNILTCFADGKGTRTVTTVFPDGRTVTRTSAFTRGPAAP